MEAIEIARKLAELGQTKEACRAYALAIHQDDGQDPAGQLEAAAYILQAGGDYRVSYTCFRKLYNQGHFREDILPLMEAMFYEPNIKQLKARYERNCKRLAKYPYLFRQDFVPFEKLPIRFFPYDDHNGYIPFYRAEERFGEFVNFGETVISRNFFKDLNKPILASDVFSQYELEYLNDNVRRSEDTGRENHIYLHYTDWAVFCSYLQCLNLRKLLESRKLVFLIGDEIGQYFGPDFIEYGEEEVFVDAGCCDLGSSITLKKYCKSLKKVYAFEPDAVCYKRCLEKKERTDFSEAEIFPCATWSEKTTLHFEVCDMGSSNVNSSGEIVIPAVTIDETIDPKDKVTFIKMDVEGAELESLKGARKVIQRDRPKLAICIYHKPEDMTEIPLYIKTLVPEYKLYVRHHSNGVGETVLYAVL